MAVDPVSEYLSAMTAFREATAEAQRLVDTIGKASELLYGYSGSTMPRRAWEKVGVSGVPGLEFSSLVRQFIDATTWPQLSDVGAAMAEAHRTYIALRNAWDHVPQDVRRSGALSQPPQFGPYEPPR